MMERNSKLNYWAVTVIGLAAFVLSLLWYSPILFGNTWMQYRHAPNPAIPKWTMVLAPLRELLASFVLAKLIALLKLTEWKKTASLMFLLWLAFHAVGMAGAVLWDNMQWQLGAVHAGDWLMKMLFMGMALTAWHNKTRKTK